MERETAKHELPAQFSIRSLLVFTGLTGLWFAIFRMWPHIAVALSSIPIVLIGLVLVRHAKNTRAGIATKTLYSLYAAMACSYTYVVSIGPVIALNEYVLHWPRFVFEFVYYPVILLHDRTSLASALERYANLWGWQ